MIRPYVLFTAAALATSACAGEPSRPVATPRATPCPVAVAPEPPRAEAVVRVPGRAWTTSLRVARFANLHYQLDCLSGVDPRCTREAFEELWKTKLGGLSEEDRRALDTWRMVSTRWAGRIEKDEDPGGDDPGVHVPRNGGALTQRIQRAGLLAEGPGRLRDNLSLLLDGPDADAAATVARRFDARFEPYWRESAPILARAAERFAVPFRERALDEAVAKVAAFYAAELAPNAEITIDLVRRPGPDGRTAGGQNGERAVIEVVDDEPAAERVPIVVHEICHFLFASVSRGRMYERARHFVDRDVTALFAWSLLDEGLATAAGNGVVGRVVVGERAFAKKLAEPLGLYGLPHVDAAARAFVPGLDALLASGARLDDPASLAAFERAVAGAFPKGPPPAGLARPYALVHEPELEHAAGALEEALAPSPVIRSSTLDPKDSEGVLSHYPRWARMLMVRTSKVGDLARWAGPLGAPLAQVPARVAAEAKKRPSFVWTEPRKGALPLFVLVAPDDEAMTKLVARLTAATEMPKGAGVLVE